MGGGERVEQCAERWPRSPFLQSADESTPESRPIRELIGGIASPCRHHCQDQASAINEEVRVKPGIAIANGLGHISQVEFDRSSATCLEIDEQSALVSHQHVAWMRLSVEQLFPGATLGDRPPESSQGIANQSSICFVERR
jgi:hypothetical protein